MESIIIQLVKDLVNIDLQEIDIEDLGNNFYQFNDYDHYGWYNSVTQELVFEVNRDGHYVPSGDTISPEMLMMLNDDILDDHHYINEKGHITYYELEEEDNY
jgi:hypothetical protein